MRADVLIFKLMQLPADTEINTSLAAHMTGSVDVGRIRLSFDPQPISTFHVSRDVRMSIDDEPINLGGFFTGFTLKVHKSDPVRVKFHVVPNGGIVKHD